MPMHIRIIHIVILFLCSVIGANSYAQKTKTQQPEKVEKKTQKRSNLKSKYRESVNNSIFNNNSPVEKKTINYEDLGDASVEAEEYLLAESNYQNAIAIQGDLILYKKLADAQLKSNKEFFALENYRLFIKKAKLIDPFFYSNEINEAKIRIAEINQVEQNYFQSIESYSDLLSETESSYDTSNILLLLNNIGNVQLDNNRDQEALKSFRKSEKLAELTGDYTQHISSLNSISEIYGNSSNIDDEIITRDKIIQIAKDENVKGVQHVSIAESFIENGRLEDALQRTRKVLELSTDLKTRKEALILMAQVYEERGNSNQAISIYKKLSGLNDSILFQKESEVEEALKQTQELAFLEKELGVLQNNSELNDERIVYLETNATIRNRLNYVLVIAVLFLLFGAFLLQRKSKQKRVANQLLALKSLRAQMNPHFLFNALNSVNSYIAQSDERSANKYLSRFSKLMRSILENSQKDFISLREEIDILTLYVDLEHTRFSDKFNYSIEIDPNLELDSIEIPPMLIQPYLENSIWHGLRYKNTEGKLNLRFIATEIGLRVEIEDDGIGRQKSKEVKTKNQMKTKSTGMSNIQSRVDIMNELHPVYINVHIKNSNELMNDVGTYVQVEISKK